MCCRICVSDLGVVVVHLHTLYLYIHYVCICTCVTLALLSLRCLRRVEATREAGKDGDGGSSVDEGPTNSRMRQDSCGDTKEGESEVKGREGQGGGYRE